MGDGMVKVNNSKGTIGDGRPWNMEGRQRERGKGREGDELYTHAHTHISIYILVYVIHIIYNDYNIIKGSLEV